MRKYTLLLGLVCGCTLDPPNELREALQNGAPRIISTTLNAPIANGRYELKLYQSYSATVVVDSGTVWYNVRLLPDNLPPTMGVAPAYIDDTIPYYSGTHTYHFTVTPNAAGNFQLAFALQDRGTWNIYDHDGGVAVAVAPPLIVSTTINAPVVGGVYQIYGGFKYTVTVKVAGGNLDYPIYLEPNNLSSTLKLTPSYVTDTVAAGSPGQLYFFDLTSSTVGRSQVAFKLLDQISYRTMSIDGGVALQVNACMDPSLVSTTIDNVQPQNGTYNLTIGKPYDVRVHVTPGQAGCTTAVQWNTQLAPTPPASANLHNIRAHAETLGSARPGGYDYLFTLTPADAGPWQLGFMLWDAGTGTAFGADGGIHVAGVSPRSGIYGTVTSKRTGSTLSGMSVQLDNNPPVLSDGTGQYQFANPGPGAHRVAIQPGLGQPYSPTVAINVTAPAAGINVDLDLESIFYTNQVPPQYQGYTRYYDYLYGRTLLHVVFVPKSSNVVALADQPSDSNGNLLDGPHAAASLNASVLINGGYFVDDQTGRYNVGYAYFRLFKDARPFPAPGRGPVLGITGTSTNQLMRIVLKEVNFLDGLTNDWHVYSANNVLWDDDGNSVSDVDWALSCGPPLLPVAAYSQDPANDFNNYWARTSVGVTAGGDLYIVVADGEGRYNRQGATANELGLFYQQLGAVTAMNFDGGGSTQLVLKDASGPHLVSTPTSENPDTAGPDPAKCVNYLWVH